MKQNVRVVFRSAGRDSDPFVIFADACQTGPHLPLLSF